MRRVRKQVALRQVAAPSVVIPRVFPDPKAGLDLTRCTPLCSAPPCFRPMRRLLELMKKNVCSVFLERFRKEAPALFRQDSEGCCPQPGGWQLKTRRFALRKRAVYDPQPDRFCPATVRVVKPFGLQRFAKRRFLSCGTVLLPLPIYLIVTLIVPVSLFLSVTVMAVVPAFTPFTAILLSLTVAVAIFVSFTTAV